MIQKKPSRKRRQSSAATPSRAQIARERSAIRDSWSTAERVRRRVDAPAAKVRDTRTQAHIRFIQFLVELEKQNS